MMRCSVAKPFVFFFFSAFLCVVTAAKISAQTSSSASLQQHTPSSNGDVRIENILKRNMFIKVFVSRNKIFVGEPVLALYKFYTALSGQAVVLKQPQFSGCSVNELSFDESPQTETVDGKAYTTFIVRKVQLTPVEPGNLSMGIATVTNHVEVSNPENAFLTNRYDIPVSNAPATVTVTDLPEKNKPEGFYGITGSFNIEASVTDKKIAAGENDHLIITIKGAGNFNAINKPEINWPAGIMHFDGTDSQHVDQNNFPISGERVFDIPFIGNKEATIKIPPVSISYFNTSARDYQTISTDSVAVTFTKALTKKDEYKNVVNYDISNRKYLWIVPALAIAVTLIAFVGYKRNKTQLKNAAAEISVTPVPVFEPQVVFKFKTDFSRHWNDLQSLQEVKPFFSKSKELLMLAVTEFTDSTHHSELFLLAAMKQKLNDEELCKKVFNLIEVCNEKIYAPFATETDLSFYFNQVKEVIQQLQSKVV